MNNVKSRVLIRKSTYFKRSQYIRVKNPLHKQSENACACVRTRDFMVSHNQFESNQISITNPF